MRQILLITALVMTCFATRLTMAQNYQLTLEQRINLVSEKQFSKLGLGFQELLDNPSAIDKFIVKDGKVSFIATRTTGATCDELKSQLTVAGMEGCVISGDLVTGWVPVDRIQDLETIPTLKMSVLDYKPHLNVGVVDSEGDRSMVTDSIRDVLGFDGTGIKIGILSDTYNALGGADSSALAGDLPGVGNPNGYEQPVVVLKDLPLGTDEGRGMAELIHDVAPGAELFFYTAFDGQLDFAAGIRALDSAGCDIIVDDVSYFAESYFQDGAIGGAVNEVVANGTTYFSSAGNSDRASYEDDYRPSGLVGLLGGELHDFGGGDVAQTLLVPAGQEISLWIMWDDPQPAFNDKPNPAPQTDMAAFLFDVATDSFLVGSDFDNIVGGFNIELVEYQNTTGVDQVVELLIEKVSGRDPRRLKYIDRAEGVVFIDQQGANAGTCVGHSNVQGAIGTGASAYFNTPEFNDFRVALGANPLEIALISAFSSAGGTPLLLDSEGNQIEPLLTNNPFVVGPDGANTSFFGSDLAFAPDGFPNFFGTSASAPHIAAASALLLQTNRELSPEDIREVLKNTAEDMDDPITPEFDEGYDVKTGHGFVNVFDAMSELLDGCDEAGRKRFFVDRYRWEKAIRSSEVSIYRAVQTLKFGGNILIQRKTEVGIDSFDTGDQDGWTTIGQTNGFGQDGKLLGMTVEDGIPSVYVKTFGRRGTTKLTPERLAPVVDDSYRFMRITAVDLVFRGCDSIDEDDENGTTVNVVIFPNPTPDVVTINGNMDEKMTVHIFNPLFRQVFAHTYEPGEEATVSLAAFGKGKYYAIISFEKGKLFKRKIIVE